MGSWWRSGLVSWLCAARQSKQEALCGLEIRKDGYSGAEEAFKLESAAVSPEVVSHHGALPLKKHLFQQVLW